MKPMPFHSKLPTTEYVYALGLVAIRHNELEWETKRWIKSLRNYSQEEVERLYRKGGAALIREKIQEYAESRFSERPELSANVTKVLAKCRELSDERNRLIHSLYGSTSSDGPVEAKYGAEPFRSIASPDKLIKLANRLRTFALVLDAIRRRGWLAEALKQFPLQRKDKTRP
jgi:hypothetical protein